MSNQTNQESPAAIPSDTATNTIPGINRRKFVKTMASGALAFTIVPRHVLGGKPFIAPSDKITLAYIGTGTQGLREMLPLLAVPEVQIVSICDPCKEAIGYKDWSRDGLKTEIRNAIKNSDWNSGGDNIVPGGRDNAKSIVDAYYASQRPNIKYKGCSAYADFRELFEKEKDLDAVKIMTPDHLHGIIAMAALKRNKHILMHKPLSNRLLEGKKVLEYARHSKSITHLVPWDSNGSMETVMAWINAGAIGKLKEVHVWTNRPVWPQYPTIPTETVAIPNGLDWDLWLGPETPRPYHPNYTNMVFRGWHDFGSGCMGDMGYYSMWTIFNALQLQGPTHIEPNMSKVCSMHDPVPYQIKNDFSFPMACSVRYKYPAKGTRPAVDLIWYDGGMKPATPAALLEDGKELPPEGMIYEGENGCILTGFYVDNAQIISGKKMESPVQQQKESPNYTSRMTGALQLFVNACKSGKPYTGNFLESEFITEAVNLYSAALRTGHLIKFDAGSNTITNNPEANKYLNREYRAGWEPASI